jgi:virginiamycin B lyase
MVRQREAIVERAVRIAIASLLLVMALRLGAVAETMPAVAHTVTEFIPPTPASRPSAITTGPDGALWFTESGGKIGRITTQGSITEFPIKGDGILHSITTGLDGALWFTEFTSKKIGRIPTTATADNLQLMEFAVPGPPGPLGITTGPDGALWFTEGVGGKIGRMTMTGVVTEFEIPTANNGEITTGPDGALWFTGIRGKIGRITTTGAVTEFTIPTENSSPWGITTGPDGALWFTEPVSGKIERITTDGKITEFALPNSNAQPWGITAGPDGALWFTESACVRQPGPRCIIGNKIGRITTTGSVTEFAVPTDGSGPHSITTGRDGALWFTEYYGSRVGRLVLP